MKELKELMEKNSITEEDVIKLITELEPEEAEEPEEVEEPEAKKPAKRKIKVIKNKEKVAEDKAKEAAKKKPDLTDKMIDAIVNEKLKARLKVTRADNPKGEILKKGDKEYPEFGRNGIAA